MGVHLWGPAPRRRATETARSTEHGLNSAVRRRPRFRVHPTLACMIGRIRPRRGLQLPRHQVLQHPRRRRRHQRRRARRAMRLMRNFGFAGSTERWESRSTVRAAMDSEGDRVGVKSRRSLMAAASGTEEPSPSWPTLFNAGTPRESAQTVNATQVDGGHEVPVRASPRSGRGDRHEGPTRSPILGHAPIPHRARPPGGDTALASGSL